MLTKGSVGIAAWIDLWELLCKFERYPIPDELRTYLYCDALRSIRNYFISS